MHHFIFIIIILNKIFYFFNFGDLDLDFLEPEPELDFVPTNLILPSRPLPPIYTTKTTKPECLLAFPEETAKFLPGAPAIKRGQTLVFATDQNGARRQVVQRDGDVLTPQQVKDQ